jgi:glycosyltransferase involved in cell wall biosynthesis
MKKKTGNLLISACMMVKDEEQNLERCLNSIKDFADEIVVVDTGSTDKTVKIAKRFKARIHHHPWQGDFSLHRNQSISYAKGKWIFIIDADEELCLTNGASWSDVKDVFARIDGKFPASAILLKDIQKGMEVMQFNSTRFFKNGKVHYEGIVHNQPQIEGQAVFNPHIYLKHYGYDLTPDKKEQKFERSKALLLKQVEENQLADGLAYFYLTQLFAEYGDPSAAVVWGEKYWSMYACGEILDKYFNVSIYFTMTKQYMKLGDQQKAYEWLERGVDKLPGDLDLAMAAIEYGVWGDNQDLILNAAKDFLLLYDTYQKEPDAKAKKFVFAMRPELLAIAQYHLTLVHLKQGVMTLQKLIGNLATLPKPFMEGMLTDLNRELKESGLPIQFGAPKIIDEESVGDPAESSKQEFTTMSLQ